MQKVGRSTLKRRKVEAEKIEKKKERRRYIRVLKIAEECAIKSLETRGVYPDLGVKVMKSRPKRNGRVTTTTFTSGEWTNLVNSISKDS